jgi:protein-disulfide isomerase
MHITRCDVFDLSKKLTVTVALSALLASCAGMAPQAEQSKAVAQQLAEVQAQLVALNKKFDDLDDRLPPRQLPKKADIAFDHRPALGEPSAKVGIVEFSDFECPFCRKFHDTTFEDIKKNYIDAGKVIFVARNSPMDIHPAAEPAAIAAQCAAEQNAFYPMQIELFKNQEQLGRPLYKQLAGDLKLEVDNFMKCLDAPAAKNYVRDDLAFATRLGVQGTPTFFVGRVEGNGLVDAVAMVGAHPYSLFTQVIDSFLKQSEDLKQATH